MARGSCGGMGIRERNIAEGRWVNTIVLILPKRFEMEEAIRVDSEAMMPVVKKSEPSLPSGTSNLRLKKYDTQDLSASAY